VSKGSTPGLEIRGMNLSIIRKKFGDIYLSFLNFLISIALSTTMTKLYLYIY
jgi:hypothetical protein